MFVPPEASFADPFRVEPPSRLRSVALMQLIAIVALALSTLIAVTAVSIGYARADAAEVAIHYKQR
jgi:hypothetical protein